MQRPVQITFHEMEPSPAIESLIREKIDRLEEHNGQIIGCRVSVNNMHKKKSSGRDYTIVVNLELPGDDLVETVHGEDVYGAIREAFRVLLRRVDKEMDKRHWDTKSHASLARGRTERVLQGEQEEYNDEQPLQEWGEGERGR